MRALLVAAFSALVFPGAAPAGEPEKPDPAAAAAAKVRAKLPVPQEEKGLAFEAVCDLEIAGAYAGTLKLGVDVGEWKEKPVWLVTEERVDGGGGDGGGGGTNRVTSSSLYLARDLTLLRGDWEQTQGANALRFHFVRGEKGLEVARERVVDGKTEELPKLVVPVAADATWGRGAALLFLKYAPAEAANYALPWVPMEAAFPGTEHETAPEVAPARVEAVGPAKFGEGKAAVDSWMAVLRNGNQVTEMHLSPKDRSLLGMERRLPTPERVVPKGTAPKTFEEDKPAATWKAAFLKFGYGYHLAVERWIVGAFHWPSAYDYDVKAGVWKKTDGETIDTYRKANVDEFLLKSKHRPRAEAAALLTMTLNTAREKTLPDGTVVLTTHPEFGGNVFHFKRVGDEWFIVGIDQ